MRGSASDSGERGTATQRSERRSVDPQQRYGRGYAMSEDLIDGESSAGRDLWEGRLEKRRRSRLERVLSWAAVGGADGECTVVGMVRPLKHGVPGSHGRWVAMPEP